MGHVNRIAQWSNEDCAGVLSFWMEAISLDWFDGNAAADRLGIHLSQIKSEYMALVAPLLNRLLAMPRTEHRFLGRVISSCVTAGVVEDSVLWRYIVDGITHEDLLKFRFDNKLRCLSHEFGDRHDNFIGQRMKQSSSFLDLVLESIEHWSNVQTTRYGDTSEGYRHGFLSKTSFEDTHSLRDIRHKDSMKLLLDAVEAAIIYHAKINSDWWQKKREELCFNHESALLYFAILACTASPESNIDLIGKMLCDKKMMEFELSYEFGALIQSAFPLLAAPAQDAVMANILTLWNEVDTNDHDESKRWILKAQAEMIMPIPCYLRSRKLQAVLDAYEKKEGILIRQPYISSRCGNVSAPFSFEVFLGMSDSGVLSLLKHYSGHYHWTDRSDFLVGGEHEVGGQLREASSRNPSRFLKLLSDYWTDIPESFRDDIMEGCATYLAYRYGNLKSNEAWESLEEPHAPLLANQILDELERHPAGWQHRRSTARALKACANVIQDTQEAERLISLAQDFVGLHENDPISGDSIGLLNLGINMAKGYVADALMILANNFREQSSEFPRLLVPTLHCFSKDEDPAIRAMILRRLPYLQSKSFDLGWELFHLAMQDADGLWDIAELCLYHAYHNHFKIVRPLLARLRSEGVGEDLETWGRISALATMSNHIEFSEFLVDLNSLDNADAWRGAATVWANSENIRWHRE